MQDISIEKAIDNYGIRNKHEKMENGELRFRLISDDYSCYIKTIAGIQGAWQSSHYHQWLRETYIVQEGWMAFAERIGDQLIIRIYRSGDVVTTEPHVAHNVYLSANSIIHTVKHGNAKEKDWFSDSILDNLTKFLTESDLLSSER